MDNKEKQACPYCRKWMIKRSTGIVLLTYPPIYPWEWWCGECDTTLSGGENRGKAIEEINMRKWKKANPV